MATIVTTVADFRIGTGAKLSVGTAGEAIDAFELVYLNATDGKIYLAQNTTVAKATLIGVAATSAAADGQMGYIPSNAGAYVESANNLWTAGKTYVVGDTAGSMMDAGDAATGDVVTVVGVASTTKLLEFVGTGGITDITVP
jgi:hypothetical protein|tara:strand:+ start:9942 stop:10367 length:426 start_codon:yes stop_codon:yes gene_type:complete